MYYLDLNDDLFAFVFFFHRRSPNVVDFVCGSQYRLTAGYQCNVCCIRELLNINLKASQLWLSIV